MSRSRDNRRRAAPQPDPAAADGAVADPEQLQATAVPLITATIWPGMMEVGRVPPEHPLGPCPAIVLYGVDGSSLKVGLADLAGAEGLAKNLATECQRLRSGITVPQQSIIVP